MCVPLSSRRRARQRAAHHGVGDHVGPRPRGIDQDPRGDDVALAARVEDEPPLLPALGAHAARAGRDDRAARGGVDGVDDDEARIVGETVGIFEPVMEPRPQRLAGLVDDQIERARSRQDSAPAERVIEQEAEPQQERRALRLVDRQDEAQRLHQMRRHPQQHLAFVQRGAHQPQRAVLQIAQAAMNELGGRRRRAGGEVVLLEQDHPEAAPGGVAGNANAVNAAPDDGEIEISH